MQVIHALNILRQNPLLLHLFAVIGYIVPHMAHLLYQPFILPCKNLLPVRGFNFFLVIPFHTFLHSEAFSHALCPNENAFLFISRNLAGTLCSMASIHSCVVNSKCLESLPMSTKFTALLLPASSANASASSAST